MGSADDIFESQKTTKNVQKRFKKHPKGSQNLHNHVNIPWVNIPGLEPSVTLAEIVGFVQAVKAIRADAEDRSVTFGNLGLVIA